MRTKFLGTGEAGYHPLRKLRTVFSGLRFAVLRLHRRHATAGEALAAMRQSGPTPDPGRAT